MNIESLWEQTCALLSRDMPYVSYNTWVEGNMVPGILEDDTMLITVKMDRMISMIQSKYADLIEKRLSEAAGRPMKIVLLGKEVKKELKLLVHPRNVRVVKMDGKNIDHNIMRNTSVYLVVYLSIFLISFIFVSIEGRDLITSFTSVAATLNNTGPGLAEVGPVGNYASMSILTKFVLMFDMLAGRLELFPVLLLFIPTVWKKA